MKSFFLLAMVVTVAQATEHGLRRPLSHLRKQDLIGQKSPLYRSQGHGIGRRPEHYETYHQESGNLYGGQRDERFYTRDSADNVRGLHYAVRPGMHHSGVSRGQILGNTYGRQQPRFQDRFIGDSLGYGTGRSRIPFRAPLANTRNYNLGNEEFGNRDLGNF